MTEHEYKFCMEKLYEKFKGKKFGEFLENAGSIASEYIFSGVIYDYEGTPDLECRDRIKCFCISKFNGGELQIDKKLKFASARDFQYHYNISTENNSIILRETFKTLMNELFRKHEGDQFNTFIPWRTDLKNTSFNYYKMNMECTLVCTNDVELFCLIDGVIECGDITFNSEAAFRDFFQTFKNY